MLKPKTYNVEDSNIANLGTELEKNVKHAAAEKEPAWEKAGGEVGLLIWRIEKFKVVAWPKAQYGSFYSGDSYILLNTYKLKDSEKLHHDIHFWLGGHTSQDEAGTAAYKTVELDDKLGGAAVQHREVQGYESPLFLGYFKDHITLLEGGVDSGFKHVEPEKYVPRLLHFKGKKKVRVTQVDCVRASLNSADVFLLDCGLKLYQFNGAKCTPFERSKAAQTATKYESERNGAKIHVCDEKGEIPKHFWEVLGGAGPIAEQDKEPPVEEVNIEHKTLWKITDFSAKMSFTQVAKGKEVKKTLLTPGDVFILDTSAEVFAWIGKSAPVAEKKNALQYGQQYMTNHKRPPYLHLARVIQGGEGDNFWHHFH